MVEYVDELDHAVIVMFSSQWRRAVAVSQSPERTFVRHGAVPPRFSDLEPRHCQRRILFSHFHQAAVVPEAINVNKTRTTQVQNCAICVSLLTNKELFLLLIGF